MHAFLFVVFFFEVSFLKYQDQKHTYRNSRICYIKYRPEEKEILPPPERKPCGECPFDQWKIQHIHDFTMQQRSISAIFGEEYSSLVKCTIPKYDAIAYAINDVSSGSRNTQRQI